MSEIPRVQLLTDIKPDDMMAGPEQDFVYSHIHERADAVREHTQDRWQAFLEAEPGSVEELSAGEQLAKDYALQTAAKLTRKPHEGDRATWAERYTVAMQEIYLKPSENVASHYVRQEQTYFGAGVGRKGVDQDMLADVLDYFGGLELSDVSPEHLVSDERAAELAGEAGTVLRAKYGSVLDVIDPNDDGWYGPDEFAQAFDLGLKRMREIDGEDWGEWSVSYTQNENLKVKGAQQEIVVGDIRWASRAGEAQGLIGHELLLHAIRANNGRRLEDELLMRQAGLPGNSHFEEGIGGFFEYAVNGVVPTKLTDRYIDVAAITGLMGDKNYTRPHMIDIFAKRVILRDQIEGRETDEFTVQNAYHYAAIQVNKMYRGSPGDDRDITQGINGDSAQYLEGFHLVMSYIDQQREAGVSMEEIIDFILMGCFNPTIPEQEEYLYKAEARLFDSRNQVQ